jgi:hypothetical protein
LRDPSDFICSCSASGLTLASPCCSGRRTSICGNTCEPSPHRIRRRPSSGSRGLDVDVSDCADIAGCVPGLANRREARY